MVVQTVIMFWGIECVSVLLGRSRGRRLTLIQVRLIYRLKIMKVGIDDLTIFDGGNRRKRSSSPQDARLTVVLP